MFIDTSIHTYYYKVMKAKRTYNLSTDTIAAVKRLVEEDHIAPTQDALVEQAIAEFARLIRDAADARLWEQAAHDPEFQAEVSSIDAELPADDLAAWDQ